MLAVGTGEGRVRLVDAATGTTRWEVQSFTESKPTTIRFCLVAMSPDGRLVASVGGDGENWTVWDAARGVVCMTGARHDGTGACSCRVARSGRSLDQGCPVQAHTAAVFAVAFSPCGQRLATGGYDNAVILWDAQTWKADLVLQGHTGGLSSLSFSATGVRLASGSRDGSIRIWDATTGGLLRTIDQAHNAWCVHFSRTDDSRLASVEYTSSLVKQWDVNTGEMLREAEGHRFAVYSPDGRTIATGDYSNTRVVLLVEAETGALRLRMAGHQHQVFSASWSVDGSKLASGSFDGTCNSRVRYSHRGGGGWELRWVHSPLGREDRDLAPDYRCSSQSRWGSSLFAHEQFHARERGRKREAVGRWHRAAVQNVRGKVLLSIFSRRTHHRNGQ